MATFYKTDGFDFKTLGNFPILRTRLPEVSRLERSREIWAPCWADSHQSNKQNGQEACWRQGHGLHTACWENSLREDEAQKKEKGKHKLGDLKDMERKSANGALLNPLKHPYIASTSSPSACKRQRMLSLGLVQKTQFKQTRRLHICLSGLLLIAFVLRNSFFKTKKSLCSVFNLSIPLNSTVAFLCLLISSKHKKEDQDA